jgi:hypothetical protein
MKSNDWKDRLGIMYSTNPDFQYNTGDEEEEETLPKEKQLLRIALDKRNLLAAIDEGLDIKNKGLELKIDESGIYLQSVTEDTTE